MTHFFGLHQQGLREWTVKMSNEILLLCVLLRKTSVTTVHYGTNALSNRSSAGLDRKVQWSNNTNLCKGAILK